MGPVGGALIVFFYQVHDICVMLVVENCGAETWDIFGILTFSLQPFRLFEHLHVTSSYVSGTWDLFQSKVTTPDPAMCSRTGWSDTASTLQVPCPQCSHQHETSALERLKRRNINRRIEGAVSDCVFTAGGTIGVYLCRDSAALHEVWFSMFE